MGVAVLFGPPISSRDPNKPGSADAEALRPWGLSSGSVLVKGSQGASNGARAAHAARTHAPRGTVAARGTATERGASAVFLIAALVAVFAILAFGVRYRDEVLVGLAGLAASAVLYKIANVSSARRIYLPLIVLLGLTATGFAEYTLVVGKYFFGTLTEPLWQSVKEYWKSLAAAEHLDLAATAAAGIVLAIIGFFYAQSKRALADVPLAILVVTTAVTAGIVVYPSSFVGRYVNVAGALGTKAPPEQKAFTSSIPPAPPTPKVQGSLPRYATVNAGNAALGLRSCPITCPVVAWVPTGATVRIVGSGENGWHEVETTMVGGATFHGFADGTMLRNP